MSSRRAAARGQGLGIPWPLLGCPCRLRGRIKIPESRGCLGCACSLRWRWYVSGCTLHGDVCSSMLQLPCLPAVCSWNSAGWWSVALPVVRFWQVRRMEKFAGSFLVLWYVCALRRMEKSAPSYAAVATTCPGRSHLDVWTSPPRATRIWQSRVRRLDAAFSAHSDVFRALHQLECRGRGAVHRHCPHL